MIRTPGGVVILYSEMLNGCLKDRPQEITKLAPDSKANSVTSAATGLSLKL